MSVWTCYMFYFQCFRIDFYFNLNFFSKLPLKCLYNFYNRVFNSPSKVEYIKARILYFQQLVRKIPISDNVLEYAVRLSTSTRPAGEMESSDVRNFIAWGAGPRASQYLVLGAKCHAAINGKYSPDIEDVQAIANYVLRHRIVRNFKAEAEGISEEHVINQLL